mgnify:CR=1 FL=1
MHITPNNTTIADYCGLMDREELEINREYQRLDGVWPQVARSYLIESIILGYPVPKLSLYQRTDVKTRKTVKEIVDGQQRTSAIYDFFKNKLRLSKTLETKAIAGKIYDELDDGDKGKFLEYPLGLDIFVAATPSEIREVFRRMNSYTIALNDEEKRHARFQGNFKWFINKITKECATSLLTFGALTPKGLLRMSDCKLFTEICHALDNGIKTTKTKELDAIYEKYDSKFPQEATWEKMMLDACGQLLDWPDLHNTELMKPHNLYALLLGIMHCGARIDTLQDVFEISKKKQKFDADTVSRLTALNDALAAETRTGKFAKFVDAEPTKTNVQAQREIRFQFICDALMGT